MSGGLLFIQALLNIKSSFHSESFVFILAQLDSPLETIAVWRAVSSDRDRGEDLHICFLFFVFHVNWGLYNAPHSF